MVRLIMLCGLPGSGKSTLAKKISSKYDCTIVSSDAIRKEFAKSIAVFITSGVVALFPLILNLMLSSMVMPLVEYDWFQLPAITALFKKISVNNILLYYFMFGIVIFVFAGLVGGLALTISLYANNLFVVLSLPFLLCIVSSRLVVYSGNAIFRGMAINKMF